MKDSIISKIPGGKTVRTIVIVVLIVIVIYFAYEIYKASKTAGNAAGQIAGATIIQSQTGISPDRQQVCRQVAIDCRNAIYVVAFTTVVFWTNNDDIINALNRLINANEAALCSQFFRENTGFSLKGVVESGQFSESYRTRITLRTSLT